MPTFKYRTVSESSRDGDQSHRETEAGFAAHGRDASARLDRVTRLPQEGAELPCGNLEILNCQG